MWNLLSIVREMFKRHDRNAVPLLEVLTEECMSCEQVKLLLPAKISFCEPLCADCLIDR